MALRNLTPSSSTTNTRPRRRSSYGVVDLRDTGGNVLRTLQNVSVLGHFQCLASRFNALARLAAEDGETKMS